MDNAFSYIIFKFFFRIREFIRHWYVRSFHVYWGYFFFILSRLDKYFALKINLRLIFKPLFGDYSFMGRILGFIFRTLRIVLALILYLFLFVFAAILYFLWFLFLPYLILSALRII